MTHVTVIPVVPSLCSLDNLSSGGDILLLSLLHHTVDNSSDETADDDDDDEDEEDDDDGDDEDEDEDDDDDEAHVRYQIIKTANSIYINYAQRLVQHTLYVCAHVIE